MSKSWGKGRKKQRRKSVGNKKTPASLRLLDDLANFGKTLKCQL